MVTEGGLPFSHAIWQKDVIPRQQTPVKILCVSQISQLIIPAHS